MSQWKNDPAGPDRDIERRGETEESSVVPIRALDPLESTMPPTPLRELLAADGASVYVLTEHEPLLSTVQEAGGEHYPVFAAGSWKALSKAVASGQCGIALLDIDAVKGTLTDRLAELTRLNPQLVILVASTRDRADTLLTLLSQRKIHRLLIKPPTVGITRLLLESAVNRHIELGQQFRRRPSAESTGGGRRIAWWLAGTLVVVGVGVAAVIAYREGTAPVPVTVRWPTRAQDRPVEPPPAVPAAPVEAPPATGVAPVSDTVGGAPAAVAVEPQAVAAPAESAVGGPAQAADGAPPSAEPVPDTAPEAAEIEARFSAVESALLDDDFETAGQLLAEIDQLEPGSSRAAFLRAQVERGQTAAAEAATRDAAAAEPDELANLIGLARARLERRQITSPAGDSALDYFERARTLDPQAPELESLAADLGEALLTAAEIELAQGQFASAEVLFRQAQTFGVSEEDLVALELSLIYARDAQARAEEDGLLAEARERIARGTLLEPQAESALAAVLEVQRRNPGNPGLPPALTELREALQRRAEAALAGGDWPQAETVIDALTQAGAAPQATDSLRAELAFRRRQEAYLAEPAPAGELTVLDFEPPVYPNQALARGTEGWVDLEFVVDPEGRPRDIVVVDAEPAGAFDEAAMAAARSYEFEPFSFDGRVYERRVSLRMRFALQ